MKVLKLLATWICRCGIGNKEESTNCTRCGKVRQTFK